MGDEPTDAEASGADLEAEAPEPAKPEKKRPNSPVRGGLRIRGPLPLGLRLFLPLIPIVALLALWFALTYGVKVESRIMSPVILPSPIEVALSAPKLLFERNAFWAVIASSIRVFVSFGVAAAIAIPLGILMGAFTPIRSMFGSVSAVGGYLPIAALVPLTLSWFGTGEQQKIAFLALATFVYLLPLVVQAIDDVDDVYLKTAYTLGANPVVATMKVLVPVAMAKIYDSLRLAIGIGWTYIILAEMVAADVGLGKLIITSQRRGPNEHIYLVLLIIIILAFITDIFLFLLGKALFRYREVSR